MDQNRPRSRPEGAPLNRRPMTDQASGALQPATDPQSNEPARPIEPPRPADPLAMAHGAVTGSMISEAPGGAGDTIEGGTGPQDAITAPVAADPKVLAAAAGYAVQVVADAVCRRVGVSPITPAERDQLAAALGQLGAVYDVQMSVRAAAWMGVGMAAGSIALVRLAELQRVRAAELPAAPDRPAAPAAPADDPLAVIARAVG